MNISLQKIVSVKMKWTQTDIDELVAENCALKKDSHETDVHILPEIPEALIGGFEGNNS